MHRLFSKGVIHLSFSIFYFLFYCTTTRKYYDLPIQLYNIMISLTFFISSISYLCPTSFCFYSKLKTLEHIIMYMFIFTTYHVYKVMCIPEIEGIVGNVVSVCIISGILLKLGTSKVPNIIFFLLYICSCFAFLCHLPMFQPLFEHRPFVFIMGCIGGFFYSFGATCFLKQLSIFLLGIIEYHEVFHFFLFLGTSCLFFPLLTI
jgi:hemolysin III